MSRASHVLEARNRFPLRGVQAAGDTKLGTACDPSTGLGAHTQCMLAE